MPVAMTDGEFDVANFRRTVCAGCRLRMGGGGPIRCRRGIIDVAAGSRGERIPRELSRDERGGLSCSAYEKANPLPSPLDREVEAEFRSRPAPLEGQRSFSFAEE